MKKTIAIMAMLAVCAAMGFAQCSGGACPAGEACQPGGSAGAKCDMPAMGCQHHSGMEHGMMGQCQDQCCTSPEMVKVLGLGEDQVKKINDLSLKHCTAMIKMEADLKIAHLEMQNLLESNASDSDIKGKAKTVSALRQKLEDAQLDHMLECRKILTAEQQKKIKTICPMMHGRGMMDCCPESQDQPKK